MPRRRPGALRAQLPAYRPWSPRPTPSIHIPGLSARTCLAVRAIENSSVDISVGDTTRALRRYREFVSGRGVRYPPYPIGCPCCLTDDPRAARDIVEKVLARLSRRARRDLWKVVVALDDAYLAVTLPAPFAHRREHRPWWHRRLSKP